MMSIGQLFLMGNKRSGSTLMVNLLNLHHRVFVTHESDIVWILYQAVRGTLHEAQCYPLDGSRGMQSTLDACGALLAMVTKNAAREQVVQTFFAVQEHIMHHGSAMDKPKGKRDLAWIGDKKPVQHSDPELRGFMNSHFPNARYIHLVRNPSDVVASMLRAAKTWKVVPDYWRGSAGDLLERWAVQEEWVLNAKSKRPNQIHTVRMEDLCSTPVKTMNDVYGFLELDVREGLSDRIEKFIDPDPGRKHRAFQAPQSDRAAKIIELYGY